MEQEGLPIVDSQPTWITGCFAYLIVKVEWYRWRCKHSRFDLNTSMLLDEFLEYGSELLEVDL